LKRGDAETQREEEEEEDFFTTKGTKGTKEEGCGKLWEN
jgi:hypothetical protein